MKASSLIINHVNYDSLICTAKEKVHESIEGVLSVEKMKVKNSNLLIISEGSIFDTEVFVKGKSLENITSIEIDRIDVKGQQLVSATITVLMPDLHIRARS